MKRYLLIIFNIVFIGAITFISARNHSKLPFVNEATDSTNNALPKALHTSYPNNSILTQQINSLLNKGLNDSAIAYCNYLKSQDAIDLNLYNLTLASGMYAMGLKQEAYKIVMKDIDYHLALGAGAGNPCMMLYNYPISKTLANDELLEDMAFNKVNDYYKALDYPETSTGLKLIKLQYQWESTKALYIYESALLEMYDENPDIQELQNSSIKAAYETLKATLIADLKDMLDNNNQKLFSLYQIGTINSNQLNLISDFVLSDSTNYWDKVMTNSLAAKVLTTDDYIAFLMTASKLKPNSPAFIQYKDSLCAKYGCDKKSFYSINDSTVLQVTYINATKIVDTLHLERDR